jgi:hypothetical protein
MAKPRVSYVVLGLALVVEGMMLVQLRNEKAILLQRVSQEHETRSELEQTKEDAANSKNKAEALGRDHFIFTWKAYALTEKAQSRTVVYCLHRERSVKIPFAL